MLPTRHSLRAKSPRVAATSDRKSHRVQRVKMAKFGKVVCTLVGLFSTVRNAAASNRREISILSDNGARVAESA